MKYTVDIITFCYNEMTILPWVVDYWKRIARRVYVFDNGSTDGSKEFLAKFDFISTIDISALTKNKLDDGLHIWIKNNLFKLLNSDFSILCDMDEYFNNIESTLDILRNGECKGIRPIYCDMVCKETPEYKKNSLFHEYNDLCRPGNSKCLIIDNSKVSEINYLPGAHTLTGLSNNEIWNCIDVYCFHIRYLSPEYMLYRRHLSDNRLSQENITHGWGVHYQYDDNRTLQDYYKFLSESIPWKEIKSVNHL